MNSRRVITFLYVVLLSGLALGAGALFVEARAEYRQLKQRHEANLRRLEEAQARLAEQERILERLRHDPVYVERVIREQLKYAKPGEQMFRFEDSPSLEPEARPPLRTGGRDR